MKYFVLLAIVVLSLMLLSGCAKNYNTVYLNVMPYFSSAQDDSVMISVSASPLMTSTNERYNNYLLNRNVSVLAVKVKNKSTHPITLSNNTISIKDGLNTKELVDLPSEALKVHQPGPLYLLWSFLFFTVTRQHEDGAVSQSPPIPVGAVIGLGNLATSYTADKKFHKDINTNHLLGRTLDINEEVMGYIGVKGTLQNTVSIKYSQKK